jgi:hypothetical protein
VFDVGVHVAATYVSGKPHVEHAAHTVSVFVPHAVAA